MIWRIKMQAELFFGGEISLKKWFWPKKGFLMKKLDQIHQEKKSKSPDFYDKFP
jgi:hypothetical protein